MRASVLLRLVPLAFALVATCVFISTYVGFSMRTIRVPRWLGLAPKEETRVPKFKCGLRKSCPSDYFAFKINSGAANVVGPSMCFENQMIMSPVKNNVDRGLNIALINGTSGVTLKYSSFDMYSGDPNHLVKFLKEIPEDTLVLVASYDDPGTKLNDAIRKLFSDLGSTHAKELGFRDSWVFLGAKNLKNKSPFEQGHCEDDIDESFRTVSGTSVKMAGFFSRLLVFEWLKNVPQQNKYEGWPELLELQGCVPKKVL